MRKKIERDSDKAGSGDDFDSSHDFDSLHSMIDHEKSTGGAMEKIGTASFEIMLYSVEALYA
jgi:hypothetical protein